MKSGPKSKTVEERFWPKVDKRGPEECWPWMAACDHDGYGVIGDEIGALKQIRAHRASWKLHCGKIPSDLFVLHTCDNPPCVNPAHLYLGTHADNMIDKSTRGRSWRGGKGVSLPGEKHPMSKLTLERVNLLLALHRCHMFSQNTIGATFGITQGQVSNIVLGKAWADVPGVIRE